MKRKMNSIIACLCVVLLAASSLSAQTTAPAFTADQQAMMKTALEPPPTYAAHHDARVNQ